VRYRPRKADQFGQRNLQRLRQGDEHVQRYGITGRLDAVNSGLGYIRFVGQRLLAPAPRLSQLAQVLPKGLQNHLIFHPGKLDLKKSAHVITCDYFRTFSATLRPLAPHCPTAFMIPPPDPTPVCIPYAQATPHQICLALAYAMGALPEHFPTLSFGVWADVLLQLKPDVWVAGDAVHLGDEDLQQLTQRLVAAPEPPELDPSINPGRAVYVFKRLFNYQDEALEALPDMAANPLAYSSRVFTLVTNLALGNSVADELFHATHRGAQGRPDRADPALARATVHEQVRELRRARGEMGYQ